MADAADLCIAHTIGRCDKPRHGKSKYCAPPNERCRSAMRDHRKRVRASGRDPRVVAGEEAESVVREVIAEEVRPAIRDVLTEEVLEGIQGIVTALPRAVAVAVKNLESGDEQIAQRAAEVIMRYSAGNKNIVPDVNAGKTGDVVVHFDLPRPVSREELAAGPGEADAVEEKVCDSCSTAKPLAEFEGKSDRCIECFERMQASVEAHALTASEQHG